MSNLYLDDNAENNFGKSISLNDLALKVKTKIGKDEVLFIDVNLKFHDSSRSEQTGIELLIWLRLKGVMNHCVLYSFETTHALLNRQPKYLVATSQGTSFIQMPEALVKIETVGLERKLAEEENLKTFLKATFDVQTFRHAYANVWGLKKLIEAHNIICPKENLSFNTNDVSNSASYHIAEYIFQSPNNPVDSYSIRLAREVLSFLRSKTGLNILYIDDQADNGWYAFLKNLFHRDVQIYKFDIKTSDFDKLYSDFSKSIFDNKIDLVISDLRLFAEEDEMLDYDDFISIKLMKKIRSEKNFGRLAFPNLSYMLFTASNKLTYYKSMIKGKVFAPQGLFIKEGFDLLYNAKQSFNNYFQLLKTLDTFFAVYKRKQGEMVELWDEEECRKTFALENTIKSNFEEQHQVEIANKLSSYTHVVLDTNVYFHFHNIPLSKSKIFLTYPVYKELLRNVKEDYNSCIGYLAKFFTDNSNPDKSCLSNNDVLEIDRKFTSGDKIEDLADGYFVQMLKQYASITNSKVLFITNDWKDKGGQISAGSQVKSWIDNEKIDNVKVIKPNDLFPAEKKTNNSFNHSKNKFQKHFNQPKANSSIKSNQSQPAKRSIQEIVYSSKILKIEKTSTRKSYRFTMENYDKLLLVSVSLFKEIALAELQSNLLNKVFTFKNEQEFTNLIQNEIFKRIDH